MSLIDEELKQLLQLVRSKSLELNTYISLDMTVGGHGAHGDHGIEVSVYVGMKTQKHHNFDTVKQAIPFLITLKGERENDNEGL